LRDLWLAKAVFRDTETGVLAADLVRMTSRLVGAIVIGFMVVAVLDVTMVRFTWLRDLRMTKQEIKDEMKEGDGDPQIKLRMRFLARQRLRKRMMAAVPQATVVITNPTHYAVALRYAREEGGAPRVVAKGRDRVALRMRAIASDHGIPIVEDRPLARALHDSVPIDAFIPPEFYKAVAKIIFILTRQNQPATGAQ
jgi:flagellar biosynthesis protein FlhB